jgi:hypothetical protein
MAVSFEQCAPFAEFVLGWGLSGSGYHACDHGSEKGICGWDDYI